MQENQIPKYKDVSLSFEERVEDLVSRMTLNEKVSQMLHESMAIKRLDIPEYNWWNECLHGVARNGTATVFPQAIGLAATWDTEQIFKTSCVISDEARAKHHEAVRHGDFGIYKGLNFWTPNINIFRDPRWGRGQETYGEDPYLTSRIAISFIKGLQGNHPKYLKAAATVKHFAVHSGPESKRHSFNVKVSKKDLNETYLAAFKDCVVEGNVESVMGAYNRTDDEPCCASKKLLTDILRNQWGFKGHVVSDCGAICDIHINHKVTNSSEESAALAVKNGCDLNCGETYHHLLNAVKLGLISETEIDIAVSRVLLTRFKLGMFDPPESVPYTSILFEKNDCPEHKDVALQTARKSIVLLKNKNNLLPLSKTLKSIAVIGPNANDRDVLLGNYNGIPSQYVTPLDGIRKKISKDTRIFYAPGCPLNEKTERGHIGRFTRGFAEAVACAKRSNVAIIFLGLSSSYEGEEGDAAESDMGGDRTHINLPGKQQELLEAIYSAGKPVVLVLLNGSAVSINWSEKNIPAIVEAWYPGQAGGDAIADVLFGDFNPAGRLPITFPKSLEQLPPFDDYNMNGEKGRTYKYMKEEPLYPFGFGLSYTSFEYSNISLSSKTIKENESLKISVDVKNIGRIAGDEVVQVYLTYPPQIKNAPLRQLKGFRRIALLPNELKKVSFVLNTEHLCLINEDGEPKLERGEYKIFIGGSQPDKRSEELTGKRVLFETFQVI